MLDGFNKEAFALIMAKVIEKPEGFAGAWDNSGWYKSRIFVGPLADKAATVEGFAGWPSATGEGVTRALQVAKRLVGFMDEAQKLLGKSWEDTTWWGHPTVPSQLLTMVHAALQAKGGTDSTRPSPLPEVRLIARIRGINKKVEDFSEQVAESTRSAGQDLKEVWSGIMNVKRLARRLNAGSWERFDRLQKLQIWKRR